MHVLIPRDQMQFVTGANSSDVIINGAHYNRTTLETYNFTTFSNDTLSNGSWCYLTKPNVMSMPIILGNGTIINGTSCYFPYYSIQRRGGIGIAFGALFAISIMFTLVCLRKHGSLFLPQEKRFRAIGRRWQWYWMLFVAACGIISSVSAVDVDRDYLQSSGILIQALFWYLMIPGLLATVWEGARHWGSWQERQMYDREPFSLPHTDRRARVEFYLPLIFYMFTWLNFFMNIPRNWLGLQSQGDPWQISAVAIPTATDNRFKAGAILAFMAWLLIPFSLWHSSRHYRPSRRFLNCIRSTPSHFLFTIPLLLIVIGYSEAQGWLWSINIGRQDASNSLLYGLGYAPAVLILYINIIAGLRSSNEDLELIQQRIARGQETDAEIGIRAARKPWWWRKVASDIGMGNDSKLRAMAGEIGGGRATGAQVERGIELRTTEAQANNSRGTEAGIMLSPFRDNTNDDDEPRGRSGQYSATQRGQLNREYSDSTGSQRTAVSQARPQQVRSMLDV